MKQIVTAGLLAWVGTTWVSGEVIYKNFGVGLSHDLGQSAMTLDLNEDGTDDFKMEWDLGGTIVGDFGFYAPFRISGLNGGSFSHSGGFVAIPEASSISVSSGWWSAPNANELATIGSYPNEGTRTWTDVLAEESSHTVAVRFEAEGGGQHYGWIRFRDSNDANPGEWGPQVFDLAYNSVPDQPILSAIVPVPEPATAALAVLGAVALAARARHRRAQG